MKKYVLSFITSALIAASCTAAYAKGPLADRPRGASRIVTYETGAESFESIHLSSSGVLPTPTIHDDGNKVSIAVRISGDSEAALDAYAKQTRRMTTDDDWGIQLGGEVSGAHVDSIEITLPRASYTNVFVNGEPAALHSSMSLKDVEQWFFFCHSDEERIEAVRTFIDTHGPHTLVAGISEVIGILTALHSDSARLAVVHAFENHVIDPKNADRVAPALESREAKAEALRVLSH